MKLVKLIRLFIAFVVVSLFIGLGMAFSRDKIEIPDDEQNDITEKSEKEVGITEQHDEKIDDEIVVEKVDIPNNLDVEENTTVQNNQNTEQQVIISQNQNSSNSKTPQNQEKQNNNYVQNSVQEQPKQEETKTNLNDKSVNTSSLDYSIHKGRIDCSNYDDCKAKSFPLQLKYINAISNSYYVDVVANDNSVLGYFIEYEFSESTYSNNEECNRIGNEIKQDLKDKISSYQCNDNILKIKASY